MTVDTCCRSCGSKLTYLEGTTGRISICSQCGWSRVELVGGVKSPGLRARLNHAFAVAHPRMA